jgi:hypothetical protein
MYAEAIKRALEGSGLRCTPQRYAVMACLMEHAGHPTAAEIFEAVNRVDPRSSRATTYNNLRDLVQADSSRMRTHFPRALHEVRSAARFLLSVVDVWIPDEWRGCPAIAQMGRPGRS